MLSLAVAPPTFAKSALPKVTPNLNAFLISYGGPYPYSLSNPNLRSINFIRYTLPAGRDTFYSFAYIYAAPHGVNKVVIRIFSPTGKVVSSSTYTGYISGSIGQDVVTTKWNHAPISSGVNVAKVWLNGHYVGKSLIWGR